MNHLRKLYSSAEQELHSAAKNKDYNMIYVICTAQRELELIETRVGSKLEAQTDTGGRATSNRPEEKGGKKRSLRQNFSRQQLQLPTQPSPQRFF